VNQSSRLRRLHAGRGSRTAADLPRRHRQHVDLWRLRLGFGRVLGLVVSGEVVGKPCRQRPCARRSPHSMLGRRARVDFRVPRPAHEAGSAVSFERAQRMCLASELLLRCRAAGRGCRAGLSSIAHKIALASEGQPARLRGPRGIESPGSSPVSADVGHFPSAVQREASVVTRISQSTIATGPGQRILSALHIPEREEPRCVGPQPPC
jgi:hypothetical protein